MSKTEFKFLPFRGVNEEIVEGRKTKVSLFEDRLEYSASFIQEVTIAFIKDDEPTEEVKESKNYCEEEGVIDKAAITAFVKYIETEYKKNGDEVNVQKIDIAYSNNVLTFALQNKEDKDKLYQELYNWKYGSK